MHILDKNRTHDAVSHSIVTTKMEKRICISQVTFFHEIIIYALTVCTDIDFELNKSLKLLICIFKKKISCSVFQKNEIHQVQKQDISSLNQFCL